MNKNRETIELLYSEYIQTEPNLQKTIKKQITEVKKALISEIIIPNTKKIKQKVSDSQIIDKTNKKMNQFQETYFWQQTQELIQMISEIAFIKQIKLCASQKAKETKEKYNLKTMKEKASTIKRKVTKLKIKIKEMNENINKKTTVIITKKMVNNFIKGQTYLNYAMASVLLNKKLKKHPNRIELVYTIEKSIDYLSAKEALKLLQKENIISNPQLLEIIKLVSKTNYPQCLALCFIANIFSQTNEENMIEIMKLISQTENYDCVKNAVSIATDSQLDPEEKLDIINQIVKGDIYTSTLIKKLATDYKKQINGDLVETAELVNLYKCRSKLQSAATQMLGENGLLSDENLRQQSIETLKHFKDYEDDETEMFGCIELYNEETDPTYDLDFDRTIQALEEMSNQQRTKVFKLIKRLHPVVQEIEKSKK